jgi:macrolide-specific efflux system membrane fusion protein
MPVSHVEPTGVADSALPPDPLPPRSRWSRQKRLLAAGAGVALVAGGTVAGILLSGGGGSSSASAAIPVVKVSDENVTVATGTMKQTVSATGTLAPANDSDLTFSVSGTINAVDVTTGETVTAGQTLATIDDTALSDEVAAAEATLTSDQDRLTTDQDDSAATSTIDSDEDQILSAQSDLATAETDLSDAKLVATFDGTVASVDYDVGESVGGGGSGAAGASTASSTSDSSDGITVISTDDYTVTTSVDDTEVSEVKAGDSAVLTVSGSTGSLDGTVASVSLIASDSDSDSGTASFPVVIDVTGSQSGLFPGASVTASIVVKQLTDVVEVPTAAISYENGSAVVTRLVGGSDRTEAVTTGVSLDGMTQITSGLSAGDVIVEQVEEFKGTGGATRSILGNNGANRSTETGPGAGGGTGFPSGGTGGFGGPGGGSTGGAPGGGF